MLTARPLSEKLAEQAYALMQIVEPSFSASSWRALVSRRLAEQNAGTGGIVVLQNAEGYLLGLIDIALPRSIGIEGGFTIRRLAVPASTPLEARWLTTQLLSKAAAAIRGHEKSWT